MIHKETPPVVLLAIRQILDGQLEHGARFCRQVFPTQRLKESPRGFGSVLVCQSCLANPINIEPLKCRHFVAENVEHRLRLIIWVSQLIDLIFAGKQCIQLRSTFVDPRLKPRGALRFKNMQCPGERNDTRRRRRKGARGNLSQQSLVARCRNAPIPNELIKFPRFRLHRTTSTPSD